MSGFNEKQRRRSIIVIGVLLFISFIFPIFEPVHFNTGKLVFVNIAYLEKSDLITTLGLLYPLIAGIIVLFVGLKVKTILRPNALLACGFLPFITALFSKKDFIVESTRGDPVKISLFVFVGLLLIGVFVGLKVISITKHFSGRLIGGISGILFLIFVLLPIKSATPIFFELFNIFKGVNRAREPIFLVFIGIELIVIFSCYIFAVIISILNLLGTLSSSKITSMSFKIVFYVTLVFPISIFIFLTFSDGVYIINKRFFVTVLIKLTLFLGGIIGLIVTGLLDLIDQSQPLKLYEKATEIKPDDHKAWYNKGNALFKLGRYNEALKAYDKAIEIKPDYHKAWSNKGVALAALGRDEEALKAFDKALEIKPEYAEAWNNKGVALEKLGRKKEAQKAFEKADEIKKKLK